ncbi:MAG TPA: hypothetical protein VNS55_15200 [Nocardioides sp.]|nr:hypothetical protein [Nocardioides sp.]
MAGTGSFRNIRTDRAVSHVECRFPTCEEAAVTAGGMCDHHRRVVVSSTGSWLEAS